MYSMYTGWRPTQPEEIHRMLHIRAKNAELVDSERHDCKSSSLDSSSSTDFPKSAFTRACPTCFAFIRPRRVGELQPSEGQKDAIRKYQAKLYTHSLDPQDTSSHTLPRDYGYLRPNHDELDPANIRSWIDLPPVAKDWRIKNAYRLASVSAATAPHRHSLFRKLPTDLQVEVLNHLLRCEVLDVFVYGDDIVRQAIYEHPLSMRLVTARDRKLDKATADAVRALWITHSTDLFTRGMRVYERLVTPLQVRRGKNIFQLFLRPLYNYYKIHSLKIADSHDCLNAEQLVNPICARYCRGWCFMSIVKASSEAYERVKRYVPDIDDGFAGPAEERRNETWFSRCGRFYNCPPFGPKIPRAWESAKPKVFKRADADGLLNPAQQLSLDPPATQGLLIDVEEQWNGNCDS